MFSKKELEIQVLCEEFYKALLQFQNTVIFNKKIEIKNIEAAVKLLEQKYPEIFWIDGCSVQYNSEAAEVSFKILNHYKPDVLKKMTAALNQKIKLALKAANKSTAYDKILAVHDYLVNTTVYDKPKLSGKTLRHTAYGCLVEGKAVCDGYAKAFYLLMKHLKIESGICSGIAEKETHAWNYVKIGQNYYWIDVTWDDPVYHKKTDEFAKWISHNYFLLNDDMLFRSRKADKNNPLLPSCRSVRDNYFVHNKLFFKDYKFSDIDKLLTTHLKDGRIEMMFASKRDLQNAVKDLFEKKNFWNANIFQTANGRKGGSVNYQIEDNLYILRIIFKIK